MSKIGEFNIAMTEKVNELGYDTVEEAIADGWDSNEFYMSYTDNMLKEQTKAHEAWLEEKKRVLEGLDYLLRGYNYTVEDAEKISNAIEFIERGEL